MKLYVSIIAASLVFLTNINCFAGSGEGVSSVGTLTSFNNTNTIIITHGYTADYVIVPIVESKWKDFIWQFAMAEAVSSIRAIYFIRKGKVYKSIATYEQFIEFTSVYPEVSIEILLNNQNYFVNENNPEFVIESHKDNVFIFDWTLESAINVHGFAEAAADILASTLIRLAISNPFVLYDLHFIGHSRGCVVNSETIQRLIYWASGELLPSTLALDDSIHMTTLDPHPAGHWSRYWPDSPDLVFMDDDKVNSSNINTGVVGWKSETHKVGFINNIWQNYLLAPFRGLSYYPGLNYSDEYSNIDLSGLFSLPTTYQAHSRIHTWFHGTVSSLDSNDSFNVGERSIKRIEWYFSPSLGSTEGFYYSLNRGGNRSLISSIDSDLKLVTQDLNYSYDKMIFNGDFEKGWVPLYGQVKFPGWSYQDGQSGFSDRYTSAAVLTDQNNKLVHNSTFIPADQLDKLYFRMQVINASSNDALNVYVGNTLVGSINLSNIILVKKWFYANIPASVRGKTNQIKFELTTTDQNFATIHIDDVGFVQTTKIRSTVACPVEFHIYDNLGNHTGPINDSTNVEEIPGSEYYVYEDSTGDKIKTVYLEPLEDNANYTFVIQSEDTTASFSYEIEDYSDTSKPTSVYQFNNIAIEPNTVATCTLDVNVQIPQLNVDNDGDGNIDSIYTPVIITSIDEGESAVIPVPVEFELFNCYPNPFNPSTTIKYSIPENSKVTIKVYDVLGREITTLLNEEKSPGFYSVQFNSLNLSSGIYFYTLQTETFSATKKMILLK